MAFLIFSSLGTILIFSFMMIGAISDYQSYYAIPQHWMLNNMKIDIPHSPSHRLEMLAWNIFLTIFVSAMPFMGVIEGLLQIK